MGQQMARRWAPFIVGGLLLLAGCSTPVSNHPLKPAELSNAPTTVSVGGYRRGSVPSGGASDSVLVILAASGGGKRSSAFSYGVLRGLRNFPIQVDGQDRRLLDELDTFAAVSGGSFTAAYYGLYRDRIFTDYEREFLKANIESYIWGIYLAPWRWGWLFNSDYGTSDEMARIYDNLLFHGATFADLMTKGKPIVSINATDINYGTVFSFTQDEFDLICSDLSTYSVANAVAASNGFPILFSPITLTNYSAQCGGRQPDWISRVDAPGAMPREHQLARLARLYEDPTKTRYVHLMDGGIADNLAMRFTLEKALTYGDNDERIRELGLDHVRRILLISADGEASRDSAWPRTRKISGLGQIISSVSGSQIDIYNFETLILVDDSLQRFVALLKHVRCAEGSIVDNRSCSDVQGFFAHLSLSDVG